MSTMETMAKKQPRPRRSFTPEFKAEVVEPVRQPGNTAGSVARDLNLTETAGLAQFLAQLGHLRQLLAGQAVRTAALIQISLLGPRSHRGRRGYTLSQMDRDAYAAAH